MSRETVVLGSAADPDSADARMSVVIHRPDGPASGRLALIVHGRDGSADAPHMLKIIRPYVALGHVVVAPNCCSSSANDSAGREADFTLAAHVRDARRALAWADASRDRLGWRGRPLALAGHSMGGYAVMRIAAGPDHDRVDHLLLVSPFSSGVRQLEARRKYHPDGLARLAVEVPRAIAEWPEHDIFPYVSRLDMPIAVVAGLKDKVAPIENVMELQNALPHARQLLRLADAAHCLEGGDYADLLARTIADLEAPRIASN